MSGPTVGLRGSTMGWGRVTGTIPVVDVRDLDCQNGTSVLHVSEVEEMEHLVWFSVSNLPLTC